MELNNQVLRNFQIRIFQVRFTSTLPCFQKGLPMNTERRPFASFVTSRKAINLNFIVFPDKIYVAELICCVYRWPRVITAHPSNGRNQDTGVACLTCTFPPSNIASCIVWIGSWSCKLRSFVGSDVSRLRLSTSNKNILVKPTVFIAYVLKIFQAKVKFLFWEGKLLF